MPVWGLIIHSPSPFHSQTGHCVTNHMVTLNQTLTTLNYSHLNLDQMAQAPNYIQLVFLKSDRVNVKWLCVTLPGRDESHIKTVQMGAFAKNFPLSLSSWNVKLTPFVPAGICLINSIYRLFLWEPSEKRVGAGGAQVTLSFHTENLARRSPPAYPSPPGCGWEGEPTSGSTAGLPASGFGASFFGISCSALPRSNVSCQDQLVPPGGL